MKFALVVSRFNEEVTSGLLHGTREYLAEKKLTVRDEDVFYAPGAFETPLLAQTLASSDEHDPGK